MIRGISVIAAHQSFTGTIKQNGQMKSNGRSANDPKTASDALK
jgi:hypothetical protein